MSLYDILGDAKVLIQDSDYGKLATIICYDAAYQILFVRQEKLMLIQC
jgi:predicted amidohydrolase